MDSACGRVYREVESGKERAAVVIWGPLRGNLGEAQCLHPL